MEKAIITLSNGMQVAAVRMEDSENVSPYLFGRYWTSDKIRILELEALTDGSVLMETAREALAIIREAYQKAQSAFAEPVETSPATWES